MSGAVVSTTSLGLVKHRVILTAIALYKKEMVDILK